MIRRLFVAVLLVATASTVEWDRQKREKLCDDGIHLIEKDLGDSSNWHCHGSSIIIQTFYTPSGYTSCQDPLQASFVCMDTDIVYNDAPPSSGKMRLVAPLYGEYKYIPPQRWLRALHYGAVAFLYDPCAPTEQIMALRDLAEACLSRHIITPYNGLSAKYPFALVTWGCVYHMTWVNRTEAAAWIKNHALQTPLSVLSAYSSGLLHNATVTLSDALCPSLLPAHPTKEPSSKAGTNAAVSVVGTSCDRTCRTPAPVPIPSTGHISFQTLLVYTLFAFLLLLLAAILLVVLAYVFHGCRTARRGHSKYKPANRFFSLGTRNKDKSVRVTIPEVGVPSPMPNEREILLNADSDEEL